MSQFRDAYGEFRRLDVEVAGISIDSPYSHRVWAKELELEFPMVSDMERTLLREYDALGQPRPLLGELAQYHAFLMDAEGVLRGIWYQPETPALSPIEEVLSATRALSERDAAERP
jgi:peroxiredoxin Q/BCP